MLWLFAQCLYYGAGTGSYTMFLVQCLYYEADILLGNFIGYAIAINLELQYI
jgi:hypothetical protein